MSDRWETIEVEHSASLLLTPGEEYDGGRARLGDEWAMVFGDPGATALVLTGTREQILKLLDDAAREISESYRAEHENAFHTEYEPQCPECDEHGPTVRITAGSLS